MTVALGKLDRRSDVDGVVMAVAVGPVPVDLGRLRLGLSRLPAAVHQVLLGCALGVPRLGEGRLDGLRVLLSADDPAGQGQHQVVALVAEGGVARHRRAGSIRRGAVHERLIAAIVNISSIGAERVGGRNVHYSASKGGLKSLNRALAVELAPHGIRVNAVGPGSIPTSILGRDWDDEDLVKSITARIPLGRMGRPEEIADAVVFLASDQASYITGQSIYVEGGRISQL